MDITNGLAGARLGAGTAGGKTNGIPAG